MVREAAAAVAANLVCDLLIVDDNSPDGTGAIADELAAGSGRVHVLHRKEKDGLGRAYVAGFHWALERGYDRVLQMDCDLSHPPEKLPELVRASMPDGGDADLVLGSRYVEGAATASWKLRRLFLSRGANFYAKFILGLPAKDVTGGYRCFKADLLARIGLDNIGARGYGFQVEMTWLAKNAGAKMAEVPIVFAARKAGYSKMTLSIMLEGLWLVWKLRLGLGDSKA